MFLYETIKSDVMSKSTKKKSKNIRKFKKKDIPNLRYGVMHSQFGYSDGVSIVMKQIEGVMTTNMKIPKKNIFYLVGRLKNERRKVSVDSSLWVKDETNQMMLKDFETGYGGDESERIESAISNAKDTIKEFITKNRINVIIAHNTSHAVNFILAIALYRYYKEQHEKNKKTPKYVLWWHDSHIERKEFRNPANDVEKYLLQGVPGRFVEYIIFINSMQFKNAEKYFLELDKLNKGYFDLMCKSHTVVYNTTETFINSYDDLETDKMSDRIETFLKDFKIKRLLKNKGLTLSQVSFCLQHTRIVDRKRIDFALKYCFELFKQKRKTGKHTKAFYFLVSGHGADNSKEKLISLHKQLCKEYDTHNFFLVFAEDFNGKTDIKFEEYPIIFAKLRGFTTYFSEIEGFGNNLLEVLASGLIPVVYTYPVFVKDISKQKFKVIALNKFEIDQRSIDATLDILRNDRKRKLWVNKNLSILKKKFSHKIIAFKLQRAIIRKRLHK